MSNTALVYLIDSVLGKGKPTSKGNRAYHCPECKHHKLKLEVNLEESSPDRKSTRLNSSHMSESRMPSSA